MQTKYGITGIGMDPTVRQRANNFAVENRNLNISEIADEMSFSSHSFFTRYVKKVLGVSPSEYRNRVK